MKGVVLALMVLSLSACHCEKKNELKPSKPVEINPNLVVIKQIDKQFGYEDIKGANSENS